MMVLGICLIFSPLYELLQLLPGFSALGKFVIFLFAVLISLPLSIFTIGIAWFFYRPIIAICLIAIAIPIIVVVTKLVVDASNENDGTVST